MEFVQQHVEDHVATVTLSRPQALNAISGRMAEEIAETFRGLATDPDVWVAILGAAGDRAFCVGADLKERAGFDDAGWAANRTRIKAMFAAIRDLPVPSIAAVFGYALGGGFELALGCDLIVASEDAVFGLPETHVGIVPGGGGTQLLARRGGPGLAKEIVLAGRRLAVDEARAAGLVSRVTPRGALAEEAADLARAICGNSPVAVREARWAIDAGAALPLEAALELEEVAWRRAVASEDRREGIAAFNEKRDPAWKNR